MDSAAPRPQVLVIGLDPYRVPGPWDPTPIAEGIEVGMARLAESGFEGTTCLVALDGSEDIEARVAAELQAARWSCVVVGGGIRGSQEQLELFEAIVNLIRLHAPQAEIAFNSAPEDIAGAVTRRLR